MNYFCRLTTIDNKTFRGLQSKQIKEIPDNEEKYKYEQKKRKQCV